MKQAPPNGRGRRVINHEIRLDSTPTPISAPSAPPSRDSAQPIGHAARRVVEKLGAARERCEVNRQIGEWIDDLRSRITYCSPADFDDLKVELERARLCIELAKERKP